MIDERLKSILEGLPFTLTSKQLDFVLSYISGRGNAVLVAPAGAGKSLVISVLKQYYGDEMLLCAATGVANQNLMDGMGGNGTAHRVFSIDTRLSTEASIKKVRTNCSSLFASSDLIKHVVVDEFFMLNPDQLYVILKRVERFNKRTGKRSKRDIRIIGIGDPCQIPSVLSDKETVELNNRYGSYLMFDSTVWSMFNPKTYIFTESMRQKDRIFQAALSVLRYGEEHRYEKVLQWFNKQVNYNYDRSLFTVATYNKTVEKVNKMTLDKNLNDKITFRAKTTGSFNLKDHSIPEEVTLCVGLECITLNNSPEGEFFNGSSLTITSVSTEGCYCLFDHSGKEVFIGWSVKEQTESKVYKDVVQKDGSIKDVLSEDVVGSCNYINLLQSSAYSCHRSQGRTFEKEGVVDMGYGFKSEGSFGCNLLYTALSRFVNVDLITLPTPLTKKHIKVCRKSIDFWKRCVEADK